MTWKLGAYDLRVDGRRDPLGFGGRVPRLSWKLCSEASRGIRQTAYQIQVRPDADTQVSWDSGRVDSRASIGVRYQGPPVESRRRYRWRVRVWGEDGAAGEWSEPATWEMGLLEPTDWTARWIGAPDRDAVPDVEDVHRQSPVPLLRKEFRLFESPVRARVYASALGLYELWINGTRVGNRVLTPGWTEYQRRVQYQTYDVTGMLAQGPNVIGALLGNGWYSGHVEHRVYVYGYTPALFLQLEVLTSDGPLTTVTSDGTWRTTSSGITGNDLLLGEEEDARAWPEEWARAGFDDTSWAPVVFQAPPGGDVTAQVDAGTTVIDTIRPVRVTSRDGVSIVDLGQNMVGHVRLEVDAAEGTEITLRHGEMLHADGQLYTDNLRSALQTDRYITRTGRGTFEPRFTYHGFRFVEVSGLADPVNPDALSACVVSEDMEWTGDFKCSDPMLEQLQRNILWGLRGNFVSVPTDCPQRDERLGWTGDAQVIAPTAAFNLDILRFFRKWLIDLEDVQHPSGGYPNVAPGAIFGVPGNAGWGDAGILVPWCLYVRYGATDCLERHYGGMRLHLEYLRASSTDHLRSDGLYCDWLGLEGPTPKGVIGTAYYAQCARVLGWIAKVLDDDRGRSEYEELYRLIRQAFVDRFVGDDGSIAGGTQVAHTLALHMDLVPDELRSTTASLLAANIEARGDHLATGLLGTALVLPVLSDHGHHELACRVAQQRSFPSWGFQVENGATTVWERWDAWTPDRGFYEATDDNSFNHYAFGSIGDWLYRYVGGLDPDPAHPGYAHARIQPRPSGTLDRAQLWHDSPHGRWEVAWQLDGEDLSLEVTVPCNATADVVLPAEPGAIRYDEGAASPPQGATAEGCPEGTSVRVCSGRFRFHAAVGSAVA
ncbi:MAG: glycoside hydrolase family 78 protein [Actinomycetota bacterium]|nr:glycoside hydrolase family 78 protein [Actinomycetota bacterium]